MLKKLFNKYKDVISFWNNKAKNLPNSVYKEMIENYYAGALYNVGSEDDALEIFARNGDYRSIKWVVREHRNIIGIKKIYRKIYNYLHSSLYHIKGIFLSNRAILTIKSIKTQIFLYIQF